MLYIVLLVIVIRAMFATTIITIVMPDSMDGHEQIGRGTMSHHVAATFVWQEPDVDWWLWFDCDTFFMNMTVPGSQRVGSRHIAGITGVFLGHFAVGQKSLWYADPRRQDVYLVGGDWNMNGL